MLRAIIIDDEKKARNNLLNMLNEYCSDVEVLGDEGTISGGIRAIEKIDPDLVFLDVEMQNETGFDLLEKIDDPNFELIFITAHHEYAIKAFKFSAIDYLLKPINIDELVSAVDKVKEKKTTSVSKEKYDVLMENIKDSHASFERIALPTSEGLTFVELNELIRCESTANYTFFFLTSGKKILVSKTIKFYDELLSDHKFYRVHQSHLINLMHIKKYVKGEGGYIIMSDDSMVIVSRRRKESFLSILSTI